ncbi:unnamed protein product [Echinostoma caproni]|uniref:ATP-dependent RNA helicase n=1 Tax=Echinostoma caproni TaxID=27848 RepID=A0A183AXM9_9TREM|nr:unnamed protein product [Echinostoma caproni]
MDSSPEPIKEVWQHLFVPDELIQALVKAQFHQPTPIQACVLPAAIRDRSDILGSAPTTTKDPTVDSVHSDSENPACVEEAMDVVVAPDDTVPNSADTESTSKKRKNKKKKSPFDAQIDLSFNRDNYLNLAVIEELDADTGEVKAVHSLADGPLTEYSVCSSASVGTKIQTGDPKCGRVYALVLLPTRELALQVRQHLRMLAEFVKPRIRIEAIVGGISVQKQSRLLSYKPHVIVATPGRLWQFIQQEDPHLCTVREANFMVVDEADKLVEANHFEDLRELFTWLHADTTGTGENKSSSDARMQHVKRRQTAVFSATLTFVHRGALKPGTGAKHRKQWSSGRNGLTKELKLSALRDLFGLSPRAKVFDLSSTSENEVPSLDVTAAPPPPQEVHTASVACPEGLQEYRFLCSDQPSKDMRLFWFLAFGRHQPVTGALSSPNTGNQRCLIFINSKSGVRRLAGVMRQLTEGNAFAVSDYPRPQYVNVLHADMLQKQRLRALERFQSDPNGILLASDVASRGLDLASMGSLNSGDGGIAWVVHFDVPHTAELYIHRRGRTARAYRTGTSVLFVCPNEIPLWRRLALSLKRIDLDLTDFPLEPTQFQLTACEKIVELARRLDLTAHTASRKKANDDWFSQAAKSADILLESDEDNEDVYDELPKSKRRKLEVTEAKRQVAIARADLQQVSCCIILSHDLRVCVCVCVFSGSILS